jgi:hypothetical protein
MAAVRTQRQLAEHDEKELVKGLRETRKRWVEREQELLDLISGKTGVQLPLVSQEPDLVVRLPPKKEKKRKEESDGFGWLSVSGVPCWHIAERAGVAKKTICGEKLPPLTKASRSYMPLVGIAERYHEEVCLDCAQSDTQPAKALADEMALLKKRAEGDAAPRALTEPCDVPGCHEMGGADGVTTYREGKCKAKTKAGKDCTSKINHGISEEFCAVHAK